MNAPVKHAEMHIMDPTGHKTVKWDRNEPDEVASARKDFEEFKKKGYSAFRTVDGDRRGERMETFDPNAEGLIMVAPLRGG
jgi:hypothetical protein